MQTKFQILERKEPKMTRLEKVRHGLLKPPINAVENVFLFLPLF